MPVMARQTIASIRPEGYKLGVEVRKIPDSEAVMIFFDLTTPSGSSYVMGGGQAPALRLNLNVLLNAQEMGDAQVLFHGDRISSLGRVDRSALQFRGDGEGQSIVFDSSEFWQAFDLA